MNDSQTSQAAFDLEAVRNTLAAIPTHIDQRHWRELRALFADSVRVDYTALSGGAAQIQAADGLIESWRKSLSPLTGTQHLLGPIQAQVRGSSATAECHVRALHVAEVLPAGKQEWTVAGHYLFVLGQLDGAWKISEMTLRVFFQTGNRGLLQEAGEQ